MPFRWRRAALLVVAVVQLASLAACGGSGGYGGGGGSNMPVAGVGPSKLFAADSTDRVVGSLANPDPAAGSLMVDRIIGPTSPYFYNYAMFSANIGSLALDTARDILYVGNGTSVLVFLGASMANGDLFTNATIGPIGNTGSMFLDSANDRLYVGDDAVDVKVFSGASTANGSPAPRHITGMTTPIHGVAVDTAKNVLYVSNDTPGVSTTHQIMVFDNADTVTTAGPSRTITPTVSNVNQTVGGIFVDNLHDVLYVAGGSASTQIMVFPGASTANDVSGATAPGKILTMPSGMLKVVVDTTHDRLYAVGFNGHIYLVENVSTLSSGPATAKDASVSGGSLTAIVVNPN
jgi:hypothetical protein